MVHHVRSHCPIHATKLNNHLKVGKWFWSLSKCLHRSDKCFIEWRIFRVSCSLRIDFNTSQKPWAFCNWKTLYEEKTIDDDIKFQNPYLWILFIIRNAAQNINSYQKDNVRPFNLSSLFKCSNSWNKTTFDTLDDHCRPFTLTAKLL